MFLTCIETCRAFVAWHPCICDVDISKRSLRIYSNARDQFNPSSKCTEIPPTIAVTRFAHDNSNMLMCGEMIAEGNHDVIRLSLLQNDKSELADESSSIKSGCVEITPCWLNNLLPLSICLQGNRLWLSSRRALQNVKKKSRGRYRAPADVTMSIRRGYMTQNIHYYGSFVSAN